MRTLMYLLVVLVSVTLLIACGSDKTSGSKKKQESESATGTPESMADAVTKAMEGLTAAGKGSAETVDHRKLKDMLKEDLRGGFSRTEYSSQSVGAFGFNVSSAEATYETSRGKTVKVTLTDTGGAGMAMMSMAAWSSMSLDKEDKNGWERTGTFEGHKSFEKYDKTRNSSELALIVENRFIVTLNGDDCDMQDLKKLAGDLDLNRMKKLI